MNNLPQDIKALVLDLIVKKTDSDWQFVNCTIKDDMVDLNFKCDTNANSSYCFKLDNLAVARANLNIWIKQVRKPYGK